MYRCEIDRLTMTNSNNNRIINFSDAQLIKRAEILESILNAPFPKGSLLTKLDFSNLSRTVSDLNDLGHYFTSDDKRNLDLFTSEIQQALVDNFTPGLHSPGLRISKLGSEPLLQGFSKLGYEVGTGVDNLWITLSGHIFEAYTRFVLRCRGFSIPDGDYSQQSLSYRGLGGHYDFILESLQSSNRFVCEVKHVSNSYLSSVLEPEKAYNEHTGNWVRTGKLTSKLKADALRNDTRGYITQLSAYSESLGLPGLFLLWDKLKNHCHVVPLTTEIKQQALRQADEVIEVMNQVETIEDLFYMVEVPQPVAQIYRGNPTGKYYLPFSMRYINPQLRDLIYDVETVEEKGIEKIYTSKNSRSVGEIIKAGYDSGYFQSSSIAA